MPLVFAYGTLKRGDVRSGTLAGQSFLGEAVTEPHYRLVDCGDYPGLLDAPGGGVAIRGELYDVTAECLAALDIVEDVADGLYARRPIRLQPPHHGRLVLAYFYLRSTDGMPEVGPEWKRR
jgi:gamma-glutamylcyclotransferase (GGCT)/AIG2-like uncharacterized protein YtfP